MCPGHGGFGLDPHTKAACRRREERKRQGSSSSQRVIAGKGNNGDTPILRGRNDSIQAEGLHDPTEVGIATDDTSIDVVGNRLVRSVRARR